MTYPGIYYQLRQIYRDLEQERARLFYDLKRKEAEKQELEKGLADTDKALNEYQAKIKEIEGGR